MSVRACAGPAFLCALVASAGLAACGGDEAPEPEQRPAAEWGRELASSPSISTSSFNAVSCSDCHALSLPDERILPGHPLPGAAARPSYWGGSVRELKGAVDACLVFFMKGDPTDPAREEDRALYEYLRSIEADGPREALPFTVVKQTIATPDRGDPARGAEVHRLACQSCHGAATTGEGRLLPGAPVLPGQAVEEALVAFPDFEPASVFVEKVRHGQFYDIGGTMPLFSLEALSEEDLGALLAFYEL